MSSSPTTAGALVVEDRPDSKLLKTIWAVLIRRRILISAVLFGC